MNKLSSTYITFVTNYKGNCRFPPFPLFNLSTILPLHSTSNFPPPSPSRATLPNFAPFNNVYVNISVAARHASTTTILVFSTLGRLSRGHPGSGMKG